MTKEEAANELIAMYAAYRGNHDDPDYKRQQAVTIAIAEPWPNPLAATHVPSTMRNITCRA